MFLKLLAAGSITSNEECVKSKNNGSNRNSKTFTAYYSGERPIKPIAEAICRNESLCENKFKEYLHTIKFNNQAKSKLCEQFKEEIPDINIENLYDISFACGLMKQRKTMSYKSFFDF